MKRAPFTCQTADFTSFTRWSRCPPSHCLYPVECPPPLSYLISPRGAARYDSLHGFPACYVTGHARRAGHSPAMSLLVPSVEWSCSQHQCRRVASAAHLFNDLLCHFTANCTRSTNCCFAPTRSTVMLNALLFALYSNKGVLPTRFLPQ